MHCGNTDVPHDPGAPCVHTTSCHHFRPDEPTGKKIASLVINVFEGKICEMLIKGDEQVLREVIEDNIGRISAALAA